MYQQKLQYASCAYKYSIVNSVLSSQLSKDGSDYQILIAQIIPFQFQNTNIGNFYDWHRCLVVSDTTMYTTWLVLRTFNQVYHAWLSQAHWISTNHFYIYLLPASLNPFFIVFFHLKLQSQPFRFPTLFLFLNKIDISSQKDIS